MNLSAGIFSDIFARRDDAGTRLDPRLKMFIAFIAIGCVVASKNAAFPAAICIACLGAMRMLRVPLALVALRLVSPLGIAGMLMIVRSALTPGTMLWQPDLLFVRISFSQEGFALGLVSGARVLGAVSIVLLLSFITPAHQIFHALRWMRMPKGWVEIATLMYRYLFTLLDLVADMTAAQRLRLGYRGWRRSLRSTAIVAGTVILRSVDQAMHTHEAMLLRGYTGALPFGPMPRFCARDRCYLAAAGLILAVLFFFCERRFA